MDDTIHILRGSAIADNAQDDEKTLKIDIQTNIDNLHESDFQAVVDLNEQFIKERGSCMDYRLILTVNPFCTNILYNTCTEIVRNEGSPDVEIVDGEREAHLTSSDMSKIHGRRTALTQYDMIRNTEYSKDEIGYEYHPGRDIFNNHILRNKTYRIVNRPAQGAYPLAARNVFNTIDDTMRAENGADIKKCCRLEVNDTVFRKKHLYDYDDILGFMNSEAVKENLVDRDGWFGFVNTSVIPSKDADGTDMDISRAINNKGNCEFVDMYPDRTLFSLVPKYNKFRNRLEKNWEYQLTYPFESVTTYEVSTQQGDVLENDILLVKDGDCNALSILDTQYVMLPNGKNALMFRCAVRHNLKSGDKFVLFYNKEDSAGTWVEIPHPCIVNGVGDLENNHQEYFFYTTDSSALEYIFIPDSESNSRWDYVKAYFYKILDQNSIDGPDPNRTYHPGNLVRENGVTYMCCAETNGFDIANFVDFSSVELPSYNPGVSDIPTERDCYVKIGNDVYELYNHDIGVPYHTSAYDANRFIRQIVNNAFRDNDNPVSDTSQAPSNPLWTDYIQFRFAKTDGTEKSSYYVRKFKKLPNIKYGDSGNEPLVDVGFDDEYYKLAYATTIYGDEVAQSVVIDNVKLDGLSDNLGRPLTDIYMTIVKTNRGHEEWYDDKGDGPGDENVEFSHCFGPITCGFDIFGLCSDTKVIKDKRLVIGDVHMICNDYNDEARSVGNLFDIKPDDDWFYGDVAEFCPWMCEETVLSDVCFRFNTAQRESKKYHRYPFYFDEIISDDYDYQGFKTEKYQISNGNYKKEGYFYKPHHRIRLRGFGRVNQGSHRAILVSSASPVQMDGIFLKIRTTVAHNVYGGDIVRLRDKTDESKEWWLQVASVLNKNTFIMETVRHGNGVYVNWMDICDALNDGVMVLEALNTSIPSYANRFKANTYLWRNITNSWDSDNMSEGVDDFPFANGCFYVDKSFNLFVRRQDPYGCNRLYDPLPQHATGNIGGSADTECNIDLVSPLPEEPVELYKDESFAIC